MGQVYSALVCSDLNDDTACLRALNRIWRLYDRNQGVAYTYNVVVDTDSVVYAGYTRPSSDSRMRVLFAGRTQFRLRILYTRDDGTIYTRSGITTVTGQDDTITGYPYNMNPSTTDSFANVTYYLDEYSSRSAAIAAVEVYSPSKPIIYRLTNCTAPSAPSEAATGSTVIVPLVFSEGFGIVSSSDAYVMNDGEQVPAIWNPNDNTITFNMP